MRTWYFWGLFVLSRLSNIIPWLSNFDKNFWKNVMIIIKSKKWIRNAIIILNNIEWFQFSDTFFVAKYAKLLIDIITHSLYPLKTLFGFLFQADVRNSRFYYDIFAAYLAFYISLDMDIVMSGYFYYIGLKFAFKMGEL